MLDKKQMESLALALSISNKTANFNKPTLKQLLKLYSDSNNNFIDTQEGDKLIAIFISNYEFKSYKDFVEVLDLMKEQKYFDSSTTFYSHFNKTITEKLFNSSFIKQQWIVDHMTTNGSFAEINNVVRFVFTKPNGNEVKFLKQIVEYVDGMKRSIIIYEAILRFGVMRTIDGLSEIFEIIFNKNPNIEIATLQNSYDDIPDEQIKLIVGEFLYKRTKEPKFLPVSAQDIFIF